MNNAAIIIVPKKCFYIFIKFILFYFFLFRKKGSEGRDCEREDSTFNSCFMVIKTFAGYDPFHVTDMEFFFVSFGIHGQRKQSAIEILEYATEKKKDASDIHQFQAKQFTSRR